MLKANMRVESGTSFFKKGHDKIAIYTISGVVAAVTCSYLFKFLDLEGSHWTILLAILIIAFLVGGFFIGVIASKEHFVDAFTCKKCGDEIKDSIETAESDLPILYMCSRCEILWYTGSS